MYKTLAEILKERSKILGKGVTFIESSESEDFLSCQELYTYALKVLSFMQNYGLEPRDELVFQIDDNKTFIIVFWACILGGIIPVPLTVAINDDHRQKLFKVWKILNNPFLIISSENVKRLKKYVDLNGDNELFDLIYDKILHVENIYDSEKAVLMHPQDEDDIAYIQFSSGSTGNPKGVMLTHKNLITNMEAISKASKYTEKDSLLSWMPLTHDMGLIGFHLNPLFCGVNHFLLPTNLFIRRPALWLDKATQHKATILCSPNFGYKYLLKQYNLAKEYNWDLSNIRIIYNGAEPISEEICHEFLNALESYGLKKTSMYPVYGLAEASVAVSFSNLEDEIISLNIDRTKTHIGETIVVKPKSESTVSFVNVGNSIPYCTIQIADNNKICDDDVIGHIQIKGDNVTSGYYNNPIALKKAITKDGWLDTGDLGFIHGGCLYVTGRSKDIIIVNGQNYYAHDIERSLEVIEDIELGKVVAAGYSSKKTGVEELVIFVLYKGKIEKFNSIFDNVKKHINQTFGFEPDYIVPVREMPKTTSGKIQRFKLIEKYTLGTFNEVIQEIKDLLSLQQSHDKFIEPTNKTEQKLTEIWSKVLLSENFGVTQKFFDIGGNSLKGAQVISSIHKEFGVELDYNILFEKQTIQEIASEIKEYEITQYETIPKIKEQDFYPLSSAQRRLYYLWEADKTSITYNIPVALMIKGKLGIEKLEKAIIQLIERHEILHSTFFIQNGESKQMFNEKVEFNLGVTQIDLKSSQDELSKRVKPYNLHKSPLFRIELLSISNDNNILFLDFHHIISDGVSISLFFDELFKIYHGEKLSELEIQYKDYTYWESKNIESEKIKKQAAYWLQQFKDDVPVLNMPTNFYRPSLMNFHGEKLEFQIDKTLTTKLKNLVKQENTSLFVLLLAAYNVLISKYAGQEDIVVGVPVAGRNHTQLHSLLGMFVNNLPIRSFPKGNFTFKKFLKQVQNTSLQAINNKDYLFENMIEQIGQKRDISRNSLFDTMFIYQNMEFSQCQKEDLFNALYFFDPGFSKYDISIEVFEQKEEIKYYIEYSTALFQKDTITKFSSHFENLLNSIVETPTARLSDLSIINTEEFSKLVINFNETKCNYPIDKVVHRLVEEQALNHPNRVAVVRGNMNKKIQYPISGILQLTYHDLNDKSNQLANFLRKKDIAPNIPVAIVLERTPELIIAILGVLKAGGCFLPIDKDIPKERIKYILSDSKTNLVITDENWLKTSNIQNSIPNIQFINITDQELYITECSDIKNINSSDDLAYIIYTSGTTGNPKGVMVEHQSLVNYTSFANKTYIKGEKVSFPLYTSISFDLTVTSIFAPLNSGNTIVTYQDNEKSLPLEDVISDNQIHILKVTPSHLKMLKEYQKLREGDSFSNIKKFIVGGEALTSQLAEDIHNIFNEKVEIYNEYGPTEATVGCMIYRYDVENDKRQTVPIGVPIDNTQIYLLDKYLKPVPIGVEGEIYISGNCLARGYLFNPQLTEKKFITNPFVSDQKMYKTGDIGKRLPDGNIEFVGRSDHQVKLNGYRIELDEIEFCMQEFEGVSNTVVSRVDYNGTNLLCAYYVSRQKIQESELRIHLQNRLPHYMVPSLFFNIDKIPLTPNGKIDKDALPEIDELRETNDFRSAENDIQKLLVSIFQDVLNLNQVGIEDNFFELGGDSIKAVQITSRLYDKGISLNVKDILTHQTISQISIYTEKSEKEYDQGVASGEKLLTPIENWFFDQEFKNPDYFNQSVLLEFKKNIDKNILEQVFNKIIEHHDGLRANYNPGKKCMFFNNDHLNVLFKVEEFKIDNTNDLEIIGVKLKSSFDITKKLLIKAGIIKEENKNDKLLITAHHLVIDGVSWRIILEDLYNLYKSLEDGGSLDLPKKTGNLIDWQNALKEYSDSDELKNQIDCWKEIDEKEFLLKKKTDSHDTNNSGRLAFNVDEATTEYLLGEANKIYNTDIQILLLISLARAINENIEIDNMVFELENHGRIVENIDVSRTTGWFTAMYPVSFEIGSGDIGYIIKEVKEKVKKVPDNGIGYGVLRYLTEYDNKPLKKKSVIRFNYLGQFGKEVSNNLFSYLNEYSGKEISDENHFTTKLEINGLVINGELTVAFNYCNVTFNESDIIALKEGFIKHINNLVFHLKNKDDIHFTPSDFDTVELDDEDLKVLFG